MAGNKTVIKEVSATFFLTDGKKAHLTGRSGVFFMDTKDMELSGDVVVRSGQYELRTAKLSYDHKSRSISTDTPILVKGEGIHLTGHSMIFSLNTEEVLVKGSVEAVFESWRL
jgi:LPS export ABC transporter protein LptC